MSRRNGRRLDRRASSAGAGGSASVFRFQTLGAGMTESGNGSIGYSYTASAQTVASNASKTLAAAADGGFSLVVGAFTGNTTLMGWNTSAPISLYTELLYGIYGENGTDTYKPITLNTFPAANGNAALPRALGDVVRTTRIGSTVVVDVSKDNGGSWVVVHTYASVSAAKLFPAIATTGAAIANNLRGSGLS